MHAWRPTTSLLTRSLTRPPCLRGPRLIPSISHPHYSYSHHARQVQAVATTDGDVALDTFRKLAWEPSDPQPLHMRRSHDLPASGQWFAQPTEPPIGDGKLNQVFLGPSFAGLEHDISSSSQLCSYEILVDDKQSSTASPSPGRAPPSSCSNRALRHFVVWLNTPTEQEDPSPSAQLYLQLAGWILLSAQESPTRSTFLQFQAPLGFIAAASRYNALTRDPAYRLTNLYVAQTSTQSLPPDLQSALPQPLIASAAGKGDIYGTSLWLGLQPTYTPLHRDPNPNLFYQLAGSKVVRLMTDRGGKAVFRNMRRRLGAQHPGSGSPGMRGAEMMSGPESELLHQAVWGDDDDSSSPDGGSEEQEQPPTKIWEAVLEPGDALYIPTHWWHSLRSVGADGSVNASVNWWFR
ncbi:hypothetical protein F4808DRAFT_266645 [Astrocystis sublimbata]|nr:hypothetical protein F4808DRAFT_266645 [Astrocystis sublimbata]